MPWAKVALQSATIEQVSNNNRLGVQKCAQNAAKPYRLWVDRSIVLYPPDFGAVDRLAIHSQPLTHLTPAKVSSVESEQKSAKREQTSEDNRTCVRRSWKITGIVPSCAGPILTSTCTQEVCWHMNLLKCSHHDSQAQRHIRESRFATSIMHSRSLRRQPCSQCWRGSL